MNDLSALASNFADLSRMIHDRAKDTVPQQVAGALRTMIMTGKLKPGQRIVERELARQLGIGQPTAREALKVLEAEGIIRRHLNRGCTVMYLSTVEIDHIFRMRIALETLVVDLVIDNPDRLIAAKLRITEELNELRGAAQQANLESFYNSALKFRKTMWHCAANPFVTGALSQVTALLYAFTVIKHSKNITNLLVSGAANYERLSQSLFRGDRDQAKKVVRSTLEEAWKLTRPLSAQTDAILGPD